MTKDEIQIAGLNNSTEKYEDFEDFEDFDEMDLVNVVIYLVMSISKYILQFEGSTNKFRLNVFRVNFSIFLLELKG